MTTPLPSRTLPDLAAASSKSSHVSLARSASATPFKALLQDHAAALPPRAASVTPPTPSTGTGPTRTSARPAASHGPKPQTPKPAASPSKPEAAKEASDDTASAPEGTIESTSARMARTARALKAPGRENDLPAEPNADATDAATLRLTDTAAVSEAQTTEGASASEETSSTAAPVDPGQALLQAWLGWTPPRPDTPGNGRSRIEGDALVPGGSEGLAQTTTELGRVERARADDGTGADRTGGLQDMLNPAVQAFMPTSLALASTQDARSGTDVATGSSPVDSLDAAAAMGAPSTAPTAPTPSTGSSAGPGPELSLGRGPQDADFAQTFALQVHNLARDGVQEATLHLHPVDLGSIAVQITLDGPQAQVDFSATQASTRELLQAHLGDLAAALQAAGLDYRGGEVRDGQASPGNDERQGEGRRQPGQRISGSGDASATPVTLQGVARPRGRLDLYA